MNASIKVVLLNPPTLEEKERTPDIGLGYVAASLRSHGHDPIVLQQEDQYDMPAVVERVLGFEPELIGIKVFSRDANVVSKLIDMLREKAPDIPIVLGGPHPSAVKPDIMWKQFGSRVNYIMKGEAELSILRMVEAMQGGDDPALLEKVPGLIWMDDTGTLRDNPTYLEPDLDKISIPAWDLMDPRTYNGSFFFWMNRDVTAPVITSRGCPFLCTFCSQNIITGKQVRHRSIDAVLDEMEMLVNDYGVRHIDIVDDHFLLHKNYVRDLCSGILERNIKITWSCGGARLDGITADLIKLVEKSGCVAMAVGLESGTDRILKMIKKALTVERAKKHIDIVAKNTNIKIMGFFVLGFPSETEEEIEQTIEFARNLPIDIATFLNFTPFPGSPLFDEMMEKGWFTDEFWLDVKVTARTYTAANMVPPEVLDKLYRKAYRRFYLRPKKIAAFVIDGFAGRQSFRPWFRRILIKFSWRLSRRSFKTVAAAESQKPKKPQEELASAAR